MTRTNQAPKCCFCVSVKAGTSALAGFILMGGLICVTFSTLTLSGVIQPEEVGQVFGDDVYTSGRLYSRSTLWINLGNGLFLAGIAVMAIYGLMKNRSGYLLPLFIVQLFQFLCTVIYIGSLVFYWHLVRRHIENCNHLPQEWKDWLLNIDDRYLALIVFGIFFIALFIKSYLISMVYKCYKHITQQALRLRQDPEISFVPDNQPQYASPIYKPPKYEDIQKVPLVEDVDDYDTKPPSYYP